MLVVVEDFNTIMATCLAWPERCKYGNNSDDESIGIKIKSVSVCVSVCLSEAQNCPSELNFCRPKLSIYYDYVCLFPPK